MSMTALVMASVGLSAPPAVAATCDSTKASTFGGGDGSANDPYLLATSGHLDAVQQDDTVWGCAFQQTANIEMAGATWTTGIGTNAEPFTGTLDGAGFRITNLTIGDENNPVDYIGLFGKTEGAAVTDVRFEGTVVGDEFVGGLIGRADSGTSVAGSNTAGSVTGRTNTGGLIGTVGNGGSVSDSSSSAAVVGEGEDTGGLIGDLNTAASLTRTYATGSVSSDGNNVGGLVGRSQGSVTESFATAAVSSAGSNNVGGLVGRLAGSVTDTFAAGSVAGNIDVGGLVGQSNSGSITRGYSTGSVTGGQEVGGLLGQGDVTESASFWDIDSSGITVSVAGAGRTTAQMRDRLTFLDADWTIADGYDAASTWGICGGANNGYPFLTWFESSEVCSGPGQTHEFVFVLPDGRECSQISPIVVRDGALFTLPGIEAECRTMPGSEVAGWRIPVPVDFAGVGSAAMPFAPGHPVLVSGSQRFTLVPFEPVLSLVFDANVAMEDACEATVDGEFLGVRDDGRASAVWIPRSLVPQATFPREVVCTPPGHRLAGWRIGDQVFEPGQGVPQEWQTAPTNRRTAFAVWSADESVSALD